MKKISRQLLTALILLVGFEANAALGTMGTLESNDDGSTNLITDTATGVTYLRFDLVDELDLAGTLLAIGPGGEYEGFSIATEAQGEAFSAAANKNGEIYTGAFGSGDGLLYSFAWYGDYKSDFVSLIEAYVVLGRVSCCGPVVETQRTDRYSKGSIEGGRYIGWLLVGPSYHQPTP
jgi:hypothetical protein